MSEQARTFAFRNWQGAASSRPFWLEQALRADAPSEIEQLHGEHRVDVCVVGGGFSGLWTALRIKELDPSVEVALVEAGLCGSGASGRNGGIVVGWWWKLPTLLKACGTDEAKRLLNASLTGIDDVAQFSADHAPEAEFAREGWYWTATTATQLGAWKATLEAIERLGLPQWETVTAEDVQRTFGSPIQLGGVVDPTAGIVQPAALARALRRVLVERRVKVFERSPVTSIEPGKEILIRTAQGSIAAGKVVLCMNAWMADQPETRSRVFTVSSDIVATEPLGDRLAELGWTGKASWSDSALRVRYARTTGDGRIVYGRGGGTLAFRSRVTNEFEHSSKLETEIRREFFECFPSLRDVQLTHAWAGPVERSFVGLPAFGALTGDPKLLFAIGYSGSGVAPSAAGGRILASLALERSDQWSELSAPLCRLFGTGKLPPEPIRYIGGRIVQRAVARYERLDHRGKQPDVVTKKIAGLVPRPVE